MTFPLASFILFLVTMNIDSFGRWQPHRIICFCYFIIIISFFFSCWLSSVLLRRYSGWGSKVRADFLKLFEPKMIRAEKWAAMEQHRRDWTERRRKKGEPMTLRRVRSVESFSWPTWWMAAVVVVVVWAEENVRRKKERKDFWAAPHTIARIIILPRLLRFRPGWTFFFFLSCRHHVERWKKKKIVYEQSLPLQRGNNRLLLSWSDALNSSITNLMGGERV